MKVKSIDINAQESAFGGDYRLHFVNEDGSGGSRSGNSLPVLIMNLINENVSEVEAKYQKYKAGPVRNIEQYTSGEKAISFAMQAVENMPAHPALTNAIISLQDAMSAVASFANETGYYNPNPRNVGWVDDSKPMQVDKHRTKQIPSVGQIVLCHKGDGKVPAIITKVHSDTCVNLRVFYNGAPEKDDFITSVIYDNEANPSYNTWSWAK